MSKRRVHDRRDSDWRDRNKPRILPRPVAPEKPRENPSPGPRSALKEIVGAVASVMDPIMFHLLTRGRSGQEREPESEIVCDAEGEIVMPPGLPSGESESR